jgi:hypothetical protein
MVLFYLFPENVARRATFSGKRMSHSALPEAIFPPNAGSPDTWQHWSFRGFRSFRVVRGPNAYRVTYVI